MYEEYVINEVFLQDKLGSFSFNALPYKILGQVDYLRYLCE
jgi:hypothetical protein